MVNVNSSLYKKIFGGSRNERYSGFHMFNQMIGGKKGEKSVNGRKSVKNGDSSSFMKLLNEKKKFLLAVFANLITQLGITYYVMMNYNVDNKYNKLDDKLDNKNASLLYWGLFAVELLIIFILALVPMPSFMKIILFSVFSVLWGIMLSFMKNVVDIKVIQMAILGTISIFGMMFLFGAMLIMFGINLGFQFAAFLFYALLLLIIVRIVVMFSGASSMLFKGLSVVGLIIFSLYIIYDTNHILQREYYGDFVTASLDYYLDILNIFVDLMSLNHL
jgi:FtsH-binding integral membrane protein